MNLMLHLKPMQKNHPWSERQINRYLTEEQSAKARPEAQQAAATMQKLRLKQTSVMASDSGVISSRRATVVAVLPTGQEFFRLIRQNRLKWRDNDADLVNVVALPASTQNSTTNPNS